MIGSDRRVSINMIGLILLIIISQSSIICAGDITRQTNGPIIYPTQNEITLQNGQNFTLHCKGKRKLKFLKENSGEDAVGDFLISERVVEVPSDPEYEHEIALDLANVDQNAVGYYACLYESVDNVFDETSILNNMKDEPNNTDDVTYIYIYVNATDSIFAPMREMISARPGTEVVIKCRPTTPDITVDLFVDFPETDVAYSPKLGFVVDSSEIFSSSPNSIPLVVSCKFKAPASGREDTKTWYIHKDFTIPPPRPTISWSSNHFLAGEDFTLNCSAVLRSNSALTLSWVIPHRGRITRIETNEQTATADELVYHNITIINATSEDTGRYYCQSRNPHGTVNSSIIMLTMIDEPFIRIRIGNGDNPLVTSKSVHKVMINIDAHPPVTLKVYKQGKELELTPPKYRLAKGIGFSEVFHIRNLTLFDTANYTFVASNEYMSNSTTLDLRKTASPLVELPENKTMQQNSTVSVSCRVSGYPLPKVTWTFRPYAEDPEKEVPEKAYTHLAEETYVSIYEAISTLPIRAVTSGNLTCRASNIFGNTTASSKVIVFEVDNGFGIVNRKQNWFAEGDKVRVKCAASAFQYMNITWTKEDEDFNGSVSYYKNVNSIVAILSLDNVTLEDAGVYTCSAEDSIWGGTMTEEIRIFIQSIKPPVISEPPIDTDIEVYPYQPVLMSCVADAVPEPSIQWFKDGELVEEYENLDISTIHTSHSTVNSTVDIGQMFSELSGKYECVASSQNHRDVRIFNVLLIENNFKPAYIGVIIAIFFLLLLLVLYLIWKIRKEKQFRKELAAAGLLYFKEGVTELLNPELGIDEQAELLPYDDRFEFPPSKLKLGKRLGAGAFGVVYLAEARGIIDAEQTTTVAVKMVKKDADNMYIKALASELKIMVHLGKHVNIVNLLGACTKNVGKRELLVIVEYCQFGNIHNYMVKHREVFINQFQENKDRNAGKVNRGFSTSTAGNHSDYYGSAHTQHTDHTFLNTGNSNRSSRKASESGYVQPEWRSNYECDYSEEGRAPRPLTSRDLLCWAFQIARGMEYLASRKVLHGDLAARNVLLAADNVVKICDFGLARSIYKNDEYQKTENGPLPLKWLAIECMTDRIFSTQSDVWAFGVVLWELFSLAKTPYAGVDVHSLLDWLTKGNRLKKPEFANDRLYELMLKCWDEKPPARPSFTELQETLGSYLEDGVRNHYVDLNAVYVDSNKARADVEDYLAMVSPPDYQLQVTPHHYVNESTFFPDHSLQHDEEGYLQMSPARRLAQYTPRPGATLNSVDQTDSNPELTPMLTVHTPNAPSLDNQPPYINMKMRPKIQEETDEVFDSNGKNTVNTAVTNPTYISIEVEKTGKNEEPTHRAMNNYVNIGHKNGLVK